MVYRIKGKVEKVYGKWKDLIRFRGLEVEFNGRFFFRVAFRSIGFCYFLFLCGFI